MTTVVAGSVALVKPLTVASRPFLRDVIFYMAAVFWTFNMLYKRKVLLGEALGVLLLFLRPHFLKVVSNVYIYLLCEQCLSLCLVLQDIWDCTCCML